jgi:hypothetical protein
LRLVITYFTGGASYSVPSDLALTYVLTVIRFLFFGFILSYYFQMPYTVVTMSLSILLADFRFFVDFTQYMDVLLGLSQEDYEEDPDE